VTAPNDDYRIGQRDKDITGRRGIFNCRISHNAASGTCHHRGPHT